MAAAPGSLRARLSCGTSEGEALRLCVTPLFFGVAAPTASAYDGLRGRVGRLPALAGEGAAAPAAAPDRVTCAGLAAGEATAPSVEDWKPAFTVFRRPETAEDKPTSPCARCAFSSGLSDSSPSSWRISGDNGGFGPLRLSNGAQNAPLSSLCGATAPPSLAASPARRDVAAASAAIGPGSGGSTGADSKTSSSPS